MEKVLNSYESLFIVDLSNGEEAAKATVNKFTTLMAENGEIVDIADWGKRRLAYPINDMNEGYYTVVTFKAEASFPAELDRIYKITDGIMRSLIIRKDDDAEVKAEDAKEETPAAEEAAE